MEKTAFILLLLMLRANATLPVVDYAGNIQNEINAVAAYIRQGLQYVQDQATAANTNLTALRELQQIENEVLALARYGDPKVIISLPGISNIMTLEAIVQQFQQDVADLTAIANGSAVSTSYDQILAQYGQVAFSTSKSGWGVTIAPTTGLIQFETSQFNVAQATQAKLQTLNSEKQTLTTQRDQCIASEAAATDTDTRTRFHNQAMSLSAAIADTNAAIQQAIQESNIQQQQIQAARGLYGTSQMLQTAAAFQQDAENGSNLNGAFGSQVANGVRITDYGYSGDYTPDAYSSNGVGNHGNQLTPYTDSNSVASAALAPDVAQAYGVSVGQTFTATSANGTTYNLRYDDTSGTPGTIDIYAPSGNLGGNNFGQNAATVSVASTSPQ